MKNYFLLFFVLFSGLICSFGQNRQQSNFKIDGTINADSGKIYLKFYSDYIPKKTTEITAEVKNKKFSISGYIPEAQGVFIALDNQYVSSDFVIEKGSQTISINVDSIRQIPIVHNKTMLEEYPKYIAFREKIIERYKLCEQKTDHLQKLYNYNLPDSIRLILDKERKDLYSASDSTLLQYAVKNPNSKIAFWSLIRLMEWGYEPIFDSIYNAFSETLKNGYAGKVLNKKIHESKLLSVGQIFPLIKCQNVNNENLSSDIFLKNKFTLVDFWYSKCGPCIRQFNSLRNLYNKYSGNGFEIIGISIDQIKDKKEWEDVILKQKLIWKQYWDKNGIESQRLSIKAFPTNFLIDNTGKIIYKNISLEELEKLLSSDN